MTMVKGNSWADVDVEELSLISLKCSSTSIEDTTENQCVGMLGPNVEDIPTPFDYKHVDTDLSHLLHGELDTANPVTKRCLVNS